LANDDTRRGASGAKRLWQREVRDLHFV